MVSETEQNSESVRRVLNLRAVSIIAVSLPVLYFLTSWLHAQQVERTSDFLLSAAKQAVQDNDPDRALGLFDQYLVLNPRDPEVEEQISLLLDEHAEDIKPLLRAFQINERLLLADKSRDDLRLRQIRIADRLKRYSEVAIHLRVLRDKRTDLSQVWHFSGIVAQDTGNFSDAISYFTTAVSLPDPVPESFEHLAELLTTFADDPVAAESVLAELLHHQDDAESRLIRAAWFEKQERYAEAIGDLNKVIADDPPNIRAHAMLVQTVRLASEKNQDFPAEEQYQKIISQLTQALTDYPQEHDLRLYLAAALWAVDKRDSAIDCLEVGIARDPRRYELQQALLDYLVAADQIDRAQQVFDRIPERALDRSSMDFMRGRLLMASKEWAAALVYLEQALALTSDDSNTSTRCGICVARCRRELGDNKAAMDAYRSLVKSNPESEQGRLGIASAYLRSNRIPLAIAEYRQLLHVDGVPEFLASLMIKEIIRQPPATRDWSEVETLLQTSDKPLIKDEAQRTLLKADLRFAQGYPSQALNILASAAARFPDNEQVRSAVSRLTVRSDNGLDQRLLATLAEDPTNLDAHISVLRLQLIRSDLDDMSAWLNGLLTGKLYPQLGTEQRLNLVARAAESVLESGRSARQNHQQIQLLQGLAEAAWKRLSVMSPDHIPRQIRFLAKHKSIDAAFAATTEANMPPNRRAECWLICLRHDSESDAVRQRVQQELTALINASPGDLQLRMVYADALILVEEYEFAETLLTNLAEFKEVSGAALARLAWMSLLIQADAEKALLLSERAAATSPGDPIVRSVRGLVLAETGQSPQALQVLQSIPGDQRATASYLYEARTLFLKGSTGAAAEQLREILPHSGDLAPPDTRMMKTLQQKLKVLPPRVSRR